MEYFQHWFSSIQEDKSLAGTPIGMNRINL
jgi:hypothetical protein